MDKIIIFCSFFFSLSLSAQDGFISESGLPKLAYWKVGTAAEKVIVLHGGPAAPHQYLRPEFDSLSKHATVIYYDQRGCGKSDTASNYKWEEHVKDLSRVIDYVAEGKKVFLAGSSWGSLLALAYAYYHPEKLKGIILSGTVAWRGMDDPFFELGENPELVIVKHEIEELRLFQKWTAEKGWTSHWKKSKRVIDWYNGVPSMEPIQSLVTAPKLRALREIQLPFLIFNGDRSSGYIKDWGETYYAVLPNSKLITIEGAGHDPWFANPRLFAEKCNEFIRERLTVNSKQ